MSSNYRNYEQWRTYGIVDISTQFRHDIRSPSKTPYGSIDLDESSTVGSFYESTIRRIVDRRLVERRTSICFLSVPQECKNPHH